MLLLVPLSSLAAVSSLMGGISRSFERWYARV